LTATLDAETLQQPLFVRKVKQGDRFVPFGMRGSKLISDYLTERKMNILEKERQLVITDCNDNILWLVGERPAAPYCVTEKTKKLLCLKWQRSL
jgi:tRNA(Ile)-lysidine synthase